MGETEEGDAKEGGGDIESAWTCVHSHTYVVWSSISNLRSTKARNGREESGEWGLRGREDETKGEEKAVRERCDEKGEDRISRTYTSH